MFNLNLLKNSNKYIVFLFATVFFIGFFVFYQNLNKESDDTVPVDSNDAVSGAINNVVKSRNESETVIKLVGCEAFPDSLYVCEPFSCEFEHPFVDNVVLKKEIIGLTSDGKCGYFEEMPNKGRMDCEYSEDIRKTIAQNLKNLISVSDILQEAIDSGQCVISGYGPSSVLDSGIGKCPSGTEYKGENYIYKDGKRIKRAICQ